MTRTVAIKTYISVLLTQNARMIKNEFWKPKASRPLQKQSQVYDLDNYDSASTASLLAYLLVQMS